MRRSVFASATLITVTLLAGCGASADQARMLRTAERWAAAQRTGNFQRTCELSASDSVAALGGEPACIHFFASYPFGHNVRIDPNGVRPSKRGVHAVSDTERGSTYYGVAVCVITEHGTTKVRFRNSASAPCPGASPPGLRALFARPRTVARHTRSNDQASGIMLSGGSPPDMRTLRALQEQFRRDSAKHDCAAISRDVLRFVRLGNSHPDPKLVAELEREGLHPSHDCAGLEATLVDRNK